MSRPRSYTAVTRELRVSVQPFFLEEQSDPDRSRYVWAYRVEIANEGSHTVQLLKRTWLITDARGRTQRVHGDGVVGEQPVLRPGDEFRYTSGTPLSTPSGIMRGLYHMVDLDTGEAFDVVIPTFSLDSPHAPGAVH
ncbi:MAG: Co2+/Mg2+ efflux protein ApaG [Rhodovarius sp.]|nr:Co2+/Mg2+ efflux protein ApaG [Rhodovarius sp.]MCX7933012.1 Co2+/Mg2+ efflux protein ApaG [Rhodovarius sp.]MDW8316067.1 Co2+/Mg2+ efflux protein ApaG [Rhodovarius sp.]